MLEKKPGMLKLSRNLVYAESTSNSLVDSFQPVDETHVIRCESEVPPKFLRNEGHRTDMVELFKRKPKFVVVKVVVIPCKRVARLLVSDCLR